MIIVGARCAGATLATLLARRGVKVLLLDAHAMPSDMPLSTHYIHHPGMAVLDEVGVGDAIRRRTRPTRTYLARVDRHDVTVRLPDDKPGYCPRRSLVDPLLLEAATAAGAQLRDRTRVVDLVREAGRVAGVVVETAQHRETLRAGLVVGADGRNSVIARLSGVEEYLGVDATRSAYWFYFPAPAIWREDPAFAGWDAFIGWEGDGMRYVFQCDDDLLLMVVAPPSAEVQAWGGDYRARTLEYLRGSSVTRPLVEASEPVGKGVGMLKARWFYRRPVGPGFALVGDAGTVKDYVTGHGISDALIGARRLHGAILEGTEAAFERYWRERDAETMPLFLDSVLKGEVGFNQRFFQMLFDNLSRAPHLAARIAAIANRELSPLEAFAPRELLPMVGRELLRGRFGVLRPFLATGRRMRGFRKEAAYRRELLARLDVAPLAAPVAAVQPAA